MHIFLAEKHCERNRAKSASVEPHQIGQRLVCPQPPQLEWGCDTVELGAVAPAAGRQVLGGPVNVEPRDRRLQDGCDLGLDLSPGGSDLGVKVPVMKWSPGAGSLSARASQISLAVSRRLLGGR